MIPSLSRPSEFRDLVCRFFSALAMLRERKAIRGKKTFCDRYGINRWNMNELERDVSRSGLFHPEWLTFLVRDYGVSADWLLTGSGDPFSVSAAAPTADKNCKRTANRKGANSKSLKVSEL